MGFLTEERRKIARDICSELTEKFNEDIIDVWLYGSVARGDDRKFSDIDMRFLVDPTGQLAEGYENPKVAKIVYELTEEMKRRGHKVVIEFQPYDAFYEWLEEAKRIKEPKNDKDLWPINIVNEGIIVYKNISKI